MVTNAESADIDMQGVATLVVGSFATARPCAAIGEDEFRIPFTRDKAATYRSIWWATTVSRERLRRKDDCGHIRPVREGSQRSSWSSPVVGKWLAMRLF
jgi:hypothetical protein